MGAFDFAQKKGFKTFMARLYGWGASIVILGALFKINHYPGANYMLLVGMSIESIIFFFSAFERPHVEVDWSVVYPELATQYGGEEVMGAPKGQQVTNQPIDDLNQLFKKAGVNVNLIQEFGEGLKKFSANAQQMVDVSAAAVANDGFVGNIKKASANLESLNTAYETQLKAVATMQPISNQKLQSAMDDLSEKLHSATSVANEGFLGSIKKASTNLESLSGAYETQLKNVADMKPINNQQLQSAIDELTNKLHASVADLSNKLHSSVEGLSGQVQTSTAQINDYQKQMQALTTNITALNSIYGNMLSAMTQNKA
jgi:gliding motility-associated protein GldL